MQADQPGHQAKEDSDQSVSNVIESVQKVYSFDRKEEQGSRYRNDPEDNKAIPGLFLVFPTGLSDTLYLRCRYVSHLSVHQPCQPPVHNYPVVYLELPVAIEHCQTAVQFDERLATAVPPVSQ